MSQKENFSNHHAAGTLRVRTNYSDLTRARGLETVAGLLLMTDNYWARARGGGLCVGNHTGASDIRK